MRASWSLIGDQSPAAGFGNITGDPFFAMTGNLMGFDQNFRLRPGSPAANAGDPSPLFNNADGTRNTMGAYGGPDAGAIGSLLPGSSPAVPFLILGLARPLTAAPVFPALVDLHAGSPQFPFNGGNPVRVIFSRPVEPATITSGLVFSVGVTPIAGTVTVFDGGRMVSFAPAVPVQAGSVVTVTGTPALREGGLGAALAVPYSNSFGTEAAATPELEAGGNTNDLVAGAEAIAGIPAVLRLAGTMFSDLDTADVYSFAGTAGERFRITVSGERLGTPVVSADFALELLDPTGLIVLIASNGGSGLVNGSGADPYVDFVLPAPGTYFLRVTAAMAAGGPYPYEVQWLRR